MHSAHNVKSLIVKRRPQGQDYTHTGVQLSLSITSIKDLFMVPNQKPLPIPSSIVLGHQFCLRTWYRFVVSSTPLRIN